jgi:chemotaxis protein MotB
MRLASSFLVTLALAGCVTTGTYDRKVAELQKITDDHDQASAAQRKELEDQLAKLQAERAALSTKLDDTTALAAELKARLEKLGQNVDKLTAEKGALSHSLDDVKGRLEDLRKQKAAADARAEVFHSLVQKLRSMIDSGQLKVAIRDGRMIIQLPNDVLFDSGKTAIKTDGQTALTKVAQALSTIPDRHFIVAGHTDNVPIHTSRFPSNWELSTRRAVEVTEYLVSNGMKPGVLAAAGYGEYDPIAANDSPDHMAQNRRIEIVLEPNIADLPSMDDLKVSAGNP